VLGAERHKNSDISVMCQLKPHMIAGKDVASYESPDVDGHVHCGRLRTNIYRRVSGQEDLVNFKVPPRLEMTR
jgi:hypothetical protein